MLQHRWWEYVTHVRHDIFKGGGIPNAKSDSTFIYLSNLETVTFQQAWKAAGLSSNMNDYFAVEDAVLVEWLT